MTIAQTLKKDLPAGLVVFIVALPLCLGVALASGAPLMSGIISGIIGGIVVGLISKSETSVSGPAAGLTAIVLGSITQLGSFELFLSALLIAGLLQLGEMVGKIRTQNKFKFVSEWTRKTSKNPIGSTIPSLKKLPFGRSQMAKACRQ